MRFKEKSRIATAFFDPPSAPGIDGNVNWRISTVDDMVSLCTQREGRFRKPPWITKDLDNGKPFDDTASEPVKPESLESESSAGHLFPLRYEPY